ncbi:hypothetical protein FH972_025744 [Carpinus fangiana]|uniref:Peroxin/Ferlin domain-containing protein n=1 Tax=Carpinus fangiana TaxID=176857 RepID=A0A5N6L4G8_9ROSI|nr:hypothetical protein FH972_025744 [Carpinus fangiana]
MASSLRSSLTRRTTLNAPGQIDMLDNTRPQAEREDSTFGISGSDGEDGLASVDGKPLSHTLSKLNRQGLRQEMAKRRYTKYSEARYNDDTRPALTERSSTGGITRTDTEASLGDSDPANTGTLPQQQDQAGRLRRGGRKVRGFMKRKKHRHGPEGDVEIDVLYENQRGAYFFGTPIFSSQSLLNFDPPAWLNAQGKPSGVNITNAQVPDPSWEWEWSSWYVDMSQDVDEQGWQYSFMFQNRFPWHGTHPWYHSYCRRRRWMRKRVRKYRPGHDGRVGDPRSLKEAHKLNSDYFSIHPASTRGQEITPSGQSATLRSGSINMLNKQREEEEEEASGEVDTIGTLLKRLKMAEVDREKIKLVLRFMEEGGQDIFYLSEQIPYIMGLLMFQYSRRQLLSAMMSNIDAADGHRKEHEDMDEPEGDEERQRIDNLLKAVEAADRQIQRLEYWSDIQDAVNKGESQGAVGSGDGWMSGWEGLDNSGPGKARAEPTDTATDETIAESTARAEPDKDRQKGKQRVG